MSEESIQAEEQAEKERTEVLQLVTLVNGYYGNPEILSQMRELAQKIQKRLALERNSH